MQIARLTPDTPAFVVEAVPSAWSVAGTYLALGVEHILLGIDHLLFVLALLLLVEGWRRLVATITSFTVAHSITLAGASLGFVHVRQRPVEAVIALSIVFVAAEIVHHRQGRPSLARSPALDRGLLLRLAPRPGLCGSPERDRPSRAEHSAGLAVLQPGAWRSDSFLFILAMLALGALATRALGSLRPASAWQTMCAYGIGAVAAFWTLERVVGLW